jgi:hypothetical protein
LEIIINNIELLFHKIIMQFYLHVFQATHPIWLKSDLLHPPLYWYVVPWEIWGHPIMDHMRVTLCHINIWYVPVLQTPVVLLPGYSAILEDRMWPIKQHHNHHNKMETSLSPLNIHSFTEDNFVVINISPCMHQTTRWYKLVSILLWWLWCCLIGHDTN